MTNLRLIASHARPSRQGDQPRIWLLYKDNETLELHVSHDIHYRRFLLDKGDEA